VKEGLRESTTLCHIWPKRWNELTAAKLVRHVRARVILHQCLEDTSFSPELPEEIIDRILLLGMHALVSFSRPSFISFRYPWIRSLSSRSRCSVIFKTKAEL
jgi:hypothetical protein